MKRSIKLFTFNGVVISMHWTFIILPVWVLADNAVKGFTWENIFWSLIFIALVFLSVGMHELVHNWATRKFSIETKELTLIPTGGISHYENFPKSAKEELLISWAGTLSNLAIAGLLLPFIQSYEPVWKISSSFDIINGPSDLLYKLHLVNLGLFAINLIPAFPLDGGNSLRAILGIRIDYFNATRIIVTIGKILAIAFLAAGILYLNLLLIVISVLIFGAGQTEEYAIHLGSLIKDLNFGDVVVNDYQHLQANNTVQEAMGILMSNHAKQFLLMEYGKPIGTVNRMRIVSEAAEKHYDLPLKNLMKKNQVYFHAEDKVEKGFKTLIASPYNNYPVMQNNRFTGVVSLMCMLEYLMLHQLTPKEHKKLKSLIDKI